jgi:hypothetical protein
MSLGAHTRIWLGVGRATRHASHRAAARI